MNAGQALGLLAGLGALNALSGGRNGTGKRFTGLLDMIDGGGAGQSGDKFEGGGLLSILGNLFAKPYEAQQNVERIAENTNATNAVTEVLKQASQDQRNLDVVDAYNTAQADAGAQAALMSEIYDDTILPAGSGGLRNRTPEVTPDLYGIGSAGEYGGLMAPENMPRPSATTAALSPTGDMASGVAPVAPMSEQLGLIAPATPTTAYPSAMSPSAPAIPQEIMSFREFVDAERAAMSGADRYLDPANYRRGYARYLSSMGINPATMGM